MGTGVRAGGVFLSEEFITAFSLFVFCSELLQFITSGSIVAMEILGDDAVSKWKMLLGPANSGVAQTEAPDSIRATFGIDGIRNAAHGPDSIASAAQVRF